MLNGEVFWQASDSPLSKELHDLRIKNSTRQVWTWLNRLIQHRVTRKYLLWRKMPPQFIKRQKRQPLVSERPVTHFQWLVVYDTLQIKNWWEQIQYKFCHRLDSNHEPLDLEAPALPTEPQLLPKWNNFGNNYWWQNQVLTNLSQLCNLFFRQNLEPFNR